MRIPVFSLSLIVACTVLQAQDPNGSEKFLARQMFYRVRNETVSKAKTQAPPKTATVAQAQPGQSGQPAASASSAAEPAVEERSDIIPASYSTSTEPLGLRYTLRKKVDDDQFVDVSPNAVFHSGDHIRLGLEVDDSGYLYLINQGTSGAWSVLFPSPEINHGDNRVEPGRLYTVPEPYSISFMGGAGVEKLFVIFTRQPEQEIDRLIYSLKGGRPVAPAPAAKSPTAAPAKPAAEPKLLMASAAPLGDNVVDGMRVYARDLIIDKVDEAAPGKKQDKAVYVVNPKGSVDSRVVADIPLKHE
jgi:hypothetical protein